MDHVPGEGWSSSIHLVSLSDDGRSTFVYSASINAKHLVWVSITIVKASKCAFLTFSNAFV